MAKSYAIETISALPFGQLIGGPLCAAVEAQSQAAKATIDFIQEVGFISANPDQDPLYLPPPGAGGGAPAADAGPVARDGDFGDVRTVTFTYTTLNGVGAQVQAQLTVPLLTVVPIPMLSVEEMTIDFVAKISEVITKSKKDQKESQKKGEGQAGGGFGPVNVGMKGSFSSTHSSTSEKSSKYQTELTLSVHVRAAAETMPKGLGRVLDILASSINSATPGQ